MIDRVIEALEIELDIATGKLEHLTQGADLYMKQLDVVSVLSKKLNELEELKNSRKFRTKLGEILLNPAVIAVIGNLMGILLIMNYERTNILVSRAMSFVRPR